MVAKPGCCRPAVVLSVVIGWAASAQRLAWPMSQSVTTGSSKFQDGLRITVVSAKPTNPGDFRHLSREANPFVLVDFVEPGEASRTFETPTVEECLARINSKRFTGGYAWWNHKLPVQSSFPSQSTIKFRVVSVSEDGARTSLGEAELSCAAAQVGEADLPLTDTAGETWGALKVKLDVPRQSLRSSLSSSASLAALLMSIASAPTAGKSGAEVGELASESSAEAAVQPGGGVVGPLAESAPPVALMTLPVAGSQPPAALMTLPAVPAPEAASAKESAPSTAPASEGHPWDARQSPSSSGGQAKPESLDEPLASRQADAPSATPGSVHFGASVSRALSVPEKLLANADGATEEAWSKLLQDYSMEAQAWESDHAPQSMRTRRAVVSDLLQGAMTRRKAGLIKESLKRLQAALEAASGPDGARAISKKLEEAIVGTIEVEMAAKAGRALAEELKGAAASLAADSTFVDLTEDRRSPSPDARSGFRGQNTPPMFVDLTDADGEVPSSPRRVDDSKRSSDGWSRSDAGDQPDQRSEPVWRRWGVAARSSRWGRSRTQSGGNEPSSFDSRLQVGGPLPVASSTVPGSPLQRHRDVATPDLLDFGDLGSVRQGVLGAVAQLDTLFKEPSQPVAHDLSGLRSRQTQESEPPQSHEVAARTGCCSCCCCHGRCCCCKHQALACHETLRASATASPAPCSELLEAGYCAHPLFSDMRSCGPPRRADGQPVQPAARMVHRPPWGGRGIQRTYDFEDDWDRSPCSSRSSSGNATPPERWEVEEPRLDTGTSDVLEATRKSAKRLQKCFERLGKAGDRCNVDPGERPQRSPVLAQPLTDIRPHGSPGFCLGQGAPLWCTWPPRRCGPPFRGVRLPAPLEAPPVGYGSGDSACFEDARVVPMRPRRPVGLTRPLLSAEEPCVDSGGAYIYNHPNFSETWPPPEDATAGLRDSWANGGGMCGGCGGSRSPYPFSDYPSEEFEDDYECRISAGAAYAADRITPRDFLPYLMAPGEGSQYYG